MVRLIILLMLLPVVVMGAPAIESIVGDMSHGGSVVIHGSGFGSKTHAAPGFWENFESGNPGDALGPPIYGEYNESQREGQNKYSATESYSGNQSSHSYHTPATVNGAAGLTAWVRDTSFYKNAFASMKFRMEFNTGTSTQSSAKMFRLNTGVNGACEADRTHGYPNMTVAQSIATDLKPTGQMKSEVNIGANALGYQTSYYNSYFGDLHGRWVSFDLWAHAGNTLELDDGFVGWVFDGAMSEKYGHVMYYSWDEMCAQDGFRNVMFLGHITENGAYINIYLDDLYADNTLSRVFIRDGRGGNNEMQIPYEWTPDGTSISVTVNTGRYETGTLVELVVVDSAGTISAGFEVYIGEDNTSTSTHPTNLQVTP